MNPKDEAAWAAADFPPYTSAPIEGARVVALCDDDLSLAQELAGLVEGVEIVTDRKEDLLGQVDGVVICDDVTQTHQRRAAPFLEAGMPTLIDKPLSLCPTEAAEILALAESHHAPLMSCSALRYSTELAALDLSTLGDITCIVGIGPGELFTYGIHVGEFIHTVLGPGVKTVRSCGDPAHNHVHLDWGDGRTASMVVLEGIAYCFRMTLLGTTGTVELEINDHQGFYRGMLVAFVEMVRTGAEPIPHANTLEIIRTMDAAVRSRDCGQEVRL
jgi:predicted dehydrogenase